MYRYRFCFANFASSYIDKLFSSREAAFQAAVTHISGNSNLLPEIHSIVVQKVEQPYEQ